MICSIISSRRVVAALVVAAERVLEHVEEALVAVRARARRPVVPGAPRARRGRGSRRAARAIVTASQRPRSSAPATTDAVWKPPVQSTGIETAPLIAARIGEVRALDVVRVALPAASA